MEKHHFIRFMYLVYTKDENNPYLNSTTIGEDSADEKLKKAMSLYNNSSVFYAIVNQALELAKNSLKQ